MQEDYYHQVDQAQQDWTLGARSAVANYYETANNMAEQSRNLVTDAFSGMEDAVATFATTGKASFSGFAESVISDLAHIAARQALVGIFNTVAGAVGSIGSGAAASAGSTAAGYTGSAFSSWLGNGMSSGGYTGDGGKYDPAGVVHGGEFVLRKEVVSQPGMRNYLEGLNAKGYADGGYVDTAPLPIASRSPSRGGGDINVTVQITSDGAASATSNTDNAAINEWASQQGKVIEASWKKFEARSLAPGGNIRTVINGRR
ncbi:MULTISPECIES: phage tail tape measure protein [Pseudomonas]|uniref:Phage tail tape measure protein n=1 Tax=Pseudomonas quercus TaxID=2722792 RepID=A0ABX0YH73_9PSED|nr:MULTISPECIES: phage tail tape measure protein [Pseudomonas]MBF7144133.1 phage tail tape measure protein [Pseudomonas sp. LY10J]NJP02735.1 phage tail tape measure protein [Pseudomonas quercus]